MVEQTPEGARVGTGVDAARAAGDDLDPALGQSGPETRGDALAVQRRVARADDADAHDALGNVATNVEQHGCVG